MHSRARPAHEWVDPPTTAGKGIKVEPPVVVACLARLHRARRRPVDAHGAVRQGRRGTRSDAAGVRGVQVGVSGELRGEGRQTLGDGRLGEGRLVLLCADDALLWSRAKNGGR